jgi:hypothetical protein
VYKLVAQPPDISQVRNFCILGDALFHDKGSCLVVSVLLDGELKLIPMRHPTKLNLQVQTILLAGLGAHPSISSLGEAIMVKSIETASAKTSSTTYNLVILCRPKDSEIAFKPTTSTDALSSTTLKVAFQEIVLPNSERSSYFFPDANQTPQPKLLDRSEFPSPQPASMELFADAAYKEAHISPESQEDVPSIAIAAKVSEPSIPLTMADIQETMSSVNAMSLMTETGLLSSSSPLMGLHLVGDIATPIPPQTTIPSSRTHENDILDLTGKFTQSKDASSLFLFSTPARRPPASMPTHQLGPRSAIKSIQCTTPMHTHISSATSPDNLSHVIVIRVEQSTCHDSVYKSSEIGDPLLKFRISATSLPPSVTSVDLASVVWNGSGNLQKLWVATGDATPDKSNLCITEISCFSMQDEDPTLRVESVQHCNLNPLLQDLGRERREGDFVIKTMSLSSSCSLEAEHEISLQLLLCRRHKHGTNTTTAPINLSRIEDVHVCLASASLPIESMERGASTTKAELQLGSESAPCPGSSTSDAAIVEKLDTILQFLRRLEQKVDTGISNLDNRLGAVEEAIRTV